MDSRVWQRYVAVACSQAWTLDVQATEELLQCIEALIAAAPVSGSAKVKVFLGRGIGEIRVAGVGDRTRISVTFQPGEITTRPGLPNADPPLASVSPSRGPASKGPPGRPSPSRDDAFRRSSR